MADKHEWFVIINAGEAKMFSDPYERLVYEAVKSYCANGKGEAPLSLRDIVKRSCVKSPACVKEKLEALIKKNFIAAVGQTTRVGGAVNVYKVLLPGTDSVPKVNSPQEESVPTGTKSVPGLASKTHNIKSKKETGDRSNFPLPQNRKDGLWQDGDHWNRWAGGKLVETISNEEFKKRGDL